MQAALLDGVKEQIYAKLKFLQSSLESHCSMAFSRQIPLKLSVYQQPEKGIEHFSIWKIK